MNELIKYDTLGMAFRNIKYRPTRMGGSADGVKVPLVPVTFRRRRRRQGEERSYAENRNSPVSSVTIPVQAILFVTLCIMESRRDNKTNNNCNDTTSQIAFPWSGGVPCG